MELTFCELRGKEVINVCDGRRFGCIIDLVFETRCARITGIVVPSTRNFFNFFKNNTDIFIPYNKIVKIGRDVILVEINPATIASSTVERCAVDSTDVESQELQVEDDG